MSKFKVCKVDPYKYQAEIKNLWDRNLPETPKGRFDWMFNNPEGSSIWYLAFHEASDQVAGSISIMPRKVLVKGKKCIAGIAGDFMVNRENRTFGPALQLANAIVKDYRKLGFDFLYTYSKDESEKIQHRAGFRSIGMISRFAKPLRVDYKLIKYVGQPMTKYISPFINYLLMLFAKEAYINKNVVHSEYSGDGELDLEFDRLCNESHSTLPILGERNGKYVKWKYFNAPQFSYKMFTYYTRKNNKLVGYIVFSAKNNVITVCDIIATSEKHLRIIIAHFVSHVRKLGYDSINIKTSRNSVICKLIKSFGFYDRKDDRSIMVIGDEGYELEEIIFYDADRNI